MRIDKDDNIWATDKGSDMIIKFNPEGRVVMVFGRKPEASDADAKPHERNNPPLPPQDGRFRQPTDVTWDRAGNIYISDGYVNSRVAKFDKDGDWVKSWGKHGKGPGEFNLVHSIAADAQGNIYVGDRNNRRIQVFDGDGNFLREIKIDVPFDPDDAKPAIGNKPDLTTYLQTGGTLTPGAPWALCITPAAEPGALQLGLLSGPHLQAQPRRQGARHARPVGQAAQAVRLDPRDRLPVRERALRRRNPELARAEAAPAPRSAQGGEPLSALAPAGFKLWAPALAPRHHDASHPMKIVKLEDFHADGGWDTYSFLKITTDEGLVGWSEFNESRRKGMAGLIHGLGASLIGEDPRAIGRIDAALNAQTRPTAGGLQSHAIAAIVNACLDIKGKALGVPVYELLGGAVRERMPVYWSRCGCCGRAAPTCSTAR